MVDHWSMLGLEEPTRDVSAIRRAYARKARECHPEEDPEGFLRLREAYQAALAYAERGACPPSPAPAASAGKRDTGREQVQADDGEEDWEPDEDGEAERPEFHGWAIPEQEPEDRPNPYEDSEAIRKFEELYTGKQRKNPKLWMDYFTSNTFLDVAWEPEFTRLMLDKVTQMERELPPGKEFLAWLYIAYQFSASEKSVLDREAMRVETYPREVTLGPGADFEGMESILRVAAKGAIPKPPRGNEFAIGQSFADYRHLARLAKSGAWGEQAVTEFKYIVRRYVPAYIKERCEQRVAADLERHPAGLRVFTHFFKAYQLPEELYRYVWQDLGLKMAIMGRAKILYGGLREIVAERVPGIGEEIQENFLQLNRALDAYLARIKGEPEREEEESAAFFAREDLQKALRSPRFIEKELLTYSKWRRDEIGSGLLRRILEFYREHPEVSGADRVAEEVGKDLDRRAVKLRDQEDAKAEGVAYYERLTLAYRPFFRHWLNTGFPTAQDPESGARLSSYLEQRLSYQEEWSRRFLRREDGTIQPRTVAACMGEVEVDFHLRHMEFRVNGRPVYRPCILWERAVIESAEWFLLILPITVAPQSWFPMVEKAIRRALEQTAALKEDQAFIAGCLAGHVCCLPEDQYTGEPIPPEEALPLEFFAEDGDRLYGCTWYESERRLVLFEQTVSGRRINKECELGLEVEDVVLAARQMLDEMVSPSHFDLSRLRELPWHVYFTANDGAEQALIRADLKPSGEEPECETPQDPPLFDDYEDEDAVPPQQEAPVREPAEDEVTAEAVSAQLARFVRGELRRLELSWFSGKLVFIKEDAGYAGFYFGNPQYNDIWYSMVSKPEVYRAEEEVAYVPFGMGKLPSYSLFDSVAGLLRNLDKVLSQMGQERIESEGPSDWVWACHPSLQNGRHKMLMAQQKLGGFPPNRGRNRLESKFIMNQHPVELESVDLSGERSVVRIKGGSYGQATTALTLFMKERLAKLRLSWVFQTPDGSTYQRHLVLLQDNWWFMMAWLQDDKERADFYAVEPDGADPKQEESEETFLGRAVPAKLVHHELFDIRNCVDLILDDLSNTEPVTERPNQFVTATEPYETIRLDLIGEEG